MYAGHVPMRMNRRRFLALAASVAGAGVAVEAFGPAAREVLLTRLDVTVPGLPETFDGVRVAQVTDVHLPANRAAAERALEILAAERPEIVVCTGDLLEEADQADVLVAFARRARGSLATFATLGNWEWKGRFGPDEAREAYAAAGVRFLDNEHAFVERDGARLAIVGVDDPVRGRPDPMRALAGLDASARLWLVHAPGIVPHLPAGPRPAFVLAGHTHGGQVRFPPLPPLRIRGAGPFLAGGYDVPSGRLYVSRGIGTSGLRMRLNCPAELPVFTLRRG
jgi:predicted MPP superfamily phosphohydrolase